jgi:hypothetical protein
MVEAIITTKTIIPRIIPIILEYSLSLLRQPIIAQKAIILIIAIKIPIIISDLILNNIHISTLYGGAKQKKCQNH